MLKPLRRVSGDVAVGAGVGPDLLLWRRKTAPARRYPV